MQQYIIDETKLADEYIREGIQAFYDKKFEESSILLQNAMNLYKKNKNIEEYIKAINILGVICAAMGNESIALDYHLKGLEYASKYQLKHLLVLFYNNIGSRYQDLGEHKIAIDYFLKAVDSLEDVAHPQNNDDWKLVVYLNLMVSYMELAEYDKAQYYLESLEPFWQNEKDKIHFYTVLIAKCQLFWLIGKKEYIYDNLDLVMSCSQNDKNSSDYPQVMEKMCKLFLWMKEYSKWEQIIFTFQKYVENQESENTHLQLVLAEMWVTYYKETNQYQAYEKACVKYVEWSQKYKKIQNEERLTAISIKIKLQEKEMERINAEKKSNMDELTELWNRYCMNEDIGKMMERALKTNNKMIIGLLDIDCFKQHNDTYGHLKGDTCLKKVADILKQSVEGYGKAYRFGGDEFVLLLESNKKESVELVAKRIKEKLEEEKIENKDSFIMPIISISQGYSIFMPKKGDTYNTALEYADKVLYKVKQRGRNNYLIELN